MARTFANYETFWLYYVSQHRDLTCRRLHVIGTSMALAFLLLAVRSPWGFLLAPVAGYGLAWLGHFGFEKNRPATFGYPWWSLRADFRMYRYMWLGRMQAELERSIEAHPGPAAG